MEPQGISTQELKFVNRDLNLADMIAVRPEVSSLIFQNCQASDDIWAQIIETLSIHKNLKRLKISGCSLQNIPKDIDLNLNPTKTQLAFSQLQQIVSFTLNQTFSWRMGPHGVRSIEKLTNLNQLDIQIRDVGQSLIYLTQLVNLNRFKLTINEEKIIVKNSPINNLKKLTCLEILSDIQGKIRQLVVNLPQLTELNIHCFVFDYNIDEECRHICQMKNLKKLTLTEFNISDIGVAFISLMTSLESLDLTSYQAQVSPVGAGYLTNLSNLRVLHLRGSRIGQEGAKRISTLKNLRDLDLSQNNVGSGINTICYGLPNLQALQLYEDYVGNQEVQEIVKLTKLTYLCLARCRIDANGIFLLLRLKNLKKVSIEENQQIPNHLIHKFRKCLPKTTISADDID